MDSENRRRFERHRHRVPCRLTQGGEASRGFVVDVSAGGLFVETKARYDPDTPVCLRIDPENRDPFEVMTRVRRKLDKHRDISAVETASGLALVLDGSHEAYFTLLAELMN